jgi:hypothetical protein
MKMKRLKKRNKEEMRLGDIEFAVLTAVISESSVVHHAVCLIR